MKLTVFHRVLLRKAINDWLEDQGIETGGLIINISFSAVPVAINISEDGSENVPLKDANENTDPVLQRNIRDLNLSVRARKAMIRLGIETIGDLVQRTKKDLLSMKGFGPVCLGEVREKLAEYELKLKGEKP